MIDKIPTCQFSNECGYIKKYYELLGFENEILKLVEDFNMEMEINENISDVIRRYINRILKEYHKSENGFIKIQ